MLASSTQHSDLPLIPHEAIVVAATPVKEENVSITKVLNAQIQALQLHIERALERAASVEAYAQLNVLFAKTMTDFIKKGLFEAVGSICPSSIDLIDAAGTQVLAMHIDQKAIFTTQFDKLSPGAQVRVGIALLQNLGKQFSSTARPHLISAIRQLNNELVQNPLAAAAAAASLPFFESTEQGSYTPPTFVPMSR